MREIKFRVWDKEAKKMLYNDFVIAPTSPTWGCFPIENPNQEQLDKINAIMEQNNLPADYTLTDWSNYYGLLNYILLQYTGLKDKNGKEIYEGDIVEERVDGMGTGREFAVYWDNEWLTFKIGHAMLSGYEVEVIGNIYENPELLEKK